MLKDVVFFAIRFKRGKLSLGTIYLHCILNVATVAPKRVFHIA